MRLNGIRKYSLAVVLEDIEAGSVIIKAWPHELVPLFEGELTTDVTDVECNGLDMTGSEYEATLKSAAYVEAEWLGSESNRVHPPDVKAREVVKLYRVGGSDKLYWESTGRKDHLRRLEHVVHAYSDVPPSETNEVELTSENCYVSVMSTREGKVLIRTSKANGEAFLYETLIDTVESTYHVTDDVNNRMGIESNGTRVYMVNKDEAMFELREQDINGFAPNNWNMEATEEINFDCKHFTLNASESVTINTTEALISATDAVTIETADCTVDSPITKFTGDVEIDGEVTAKKSVTVTENVIAGKAVQYGTTLGNAAGTVSFSGSGADIQMSVSVKQLTSEQPISAPNV